MHEMAPRDHNQPPSQIEFAQQTGDELGEWLKNHPVILSEDEARDGKLLVDRARLSLQDMEDERKAKTRPLYKQITDVDDQYRSPRSILEKILAELKERLNAYIKKEEENRLHALAEARAKAEAAELAAREAEARERDAKLEALAGAESDIGGLTKEADEAFQAFQQLQRALARAEKATDVKIGGGIGRALSTRFKEELIVDNPATAVAEMGWSERLLNALLTDAREYRRQRGRLPVGIFAKGERRL